jgi:hypothetical protein
MSDAWPSPDAQRGPLPRIEDLPLAEQGYDQEAVRAAFDSFYRHAAQLDASLRALETVEVFRRDADALRNDLRAIRALGAGFGDEPAWATQTYERARPEVPAVAFRLLAEAALLIAVAVIAGVANLSTAAIVGLMSAAFVIVACSEWLAARARYVAPVSGFVTHEALEPAPYVEAPAPVWSAPAPEPDEETEPEALTVIGAPAAEDTEEADAVDDDAADVDEPDEADDADDVADPWEQAAADEAEPEPEEAGQGFLRRLRR